MAATGVTVADEAVAEYEAFKKSSNPAKFVVFKIESGKIVLETISESTNFEEFRAILPAGDCRYAIYKMDFTTNDGRPNTKLASIAW